MSLESFGQETKDKIKSKFNDVNTTSLLNIFVVYWDIIDGYKQFRPNTPIKELAKIGLIQFSRGNQVDIVIPSFSEEGRKLYWFLKRQGYPV